MNHFSFLEKGIESWNRWRANNARVLCDLSEQDLSHGYFFEGNFRGVNFKGADLRRACLIGADLRGADLREADLSGAYLGDANLYGADLSYANLTEANLDRADLRHTNLLGTQIAAADIRTAQLPDPADNPYADVLINTLTQAQRASREAATVSRSTAKPPAKALRQTLLQQMVLHLRSLTHASAEVAALRQQAIRQSAAPLVLTGYAEGDRTQKTPKTSQRTTRQIWGRANQRLVQRSILIAAAGGSLFLAVGLPLDVFSSNIQQVVAQSKDQVQTQKQSPAASLALAQSLTGTSEIWAVAIHQSVDNPDGWVIGGESDGQIQIWDVQTGIRIRTLAGHSAGVRSLAVSKSGRWLVSGSSDGLKVWQMDAGTRTLTLVRSLLAAQSAASSAAQYSVRSVAISPDEKTLISSDDQGQITVWDLPSGAQRYQVDNGAAVWSLAIAPNGQSFVSSSSDPTVRQWDLASGKRLKEFAGHEDAVRAVAISPDSKNLISASWDRKLNLWDLNTGNLIATLNSDQGGHQDRIVSLAISPDGKTLASGSHDNTIKLWDLPSRQLRETLDAQIGWIFSLAFDAQSKNLVSGGKDQTIKVWR